MKTGDINTFLIDGYLRMLDSLTPGNKLDLIAKLSISLKADIPDNKKSFYKSYGAWDSKQSAEDIISDIKKSRTFKRQIDTF